MAKKFKTGIPEGTKIPVHIGMIMDGNGRWAKKRGLPRKIGHRQGAEVFRKMTIYAKNVGVKYFTVYAFSTENWRRPPDEVEALMDLFEKYLDDVWDFIDERIRICFIGDRSILRQSLRDKMAHVEKISVGFENMTLLIAINYGGRDEIVHAAKLLAGRVKAGELEPSDIDEQLINDNLYTAEMSNDIAPDVDLIIRPSGEQRLSNFLIWQAAYAEYYFTDILWPDFKPKDLDDAIVAYSDRKRRFGAV